MDANRPAFRIRDAVWLLLCMVASSAWCLTAESHLSATFDEPFYVKAGLECWRSGSYKPLMSAGAMPLAIDVQTLPLYVWERFRGAPFEPISDLPQLLPVARAATLVFWWLLLFYLWRLGREFGGVWGGRLAVGLVAFDPNFLAHACLVTSDIAVAACLLALAYCFYRGRDGGWWRRVGLPAGWYGLAVLAKASGLVFGPLLMVVLGLYKLRASEQNSSPNPEPRTPNPNWLRRLWSSTYQLRWDLTQIVLLGLVVVFAYCGCDWQAEPTFVAWASGLPEGTLRAVMLWLAEHLRIFTNAGEGLIQQIKHNMRGHGAYLLGDWAPRAIWYYFPVALAIKVPLPLLAFLAGLLLVRPRALLNPPGLVALLLLAFSLNCRVQIGVRYMLPLVAFAAVAASAALVNARPAVGFGRWRAGLAGALVAGTLIAAVDVWPHGLCYSNRLWGGPERGYRLLSDSNYDWGQGLKELARWEEDHGRPVLRVWYYGTDPAILLPPFHVLPLHILPLRGPADVEALARGGYLAVGTSLLYGDPHLTPSAAQALGALRRKAPVGRTATFLIYDFTEPDEKNGPRSGATRTP